MRAFNAWLTWTIKKKNLEAQETVKYNQGANQVQASYFTNYCLCKGTFLSKLHFFHTLFFFFPPPDYGEMSWWLNWNKNLFLQFCFYTSIFVILGWVLSGWNISEQAPADGKWLRWLEYFATTLLLESKVPSSEQVTIYVSILSLEPVHSLLHSS